MCQKIEIKQWNNVILFLSTYYNSKAYRTNLFYRLFNVMMFTSVSSP